MLTKCQTPCDIGGMSQYYALKGRKGDRPLCAHSIAAIRKGIGVNQWQEQTQPFPPAHL